VTGAVPDLLLMTHVGATCVMTGVIWFVQVVHYPLFGAIGREAFPAYERRNTTLTTWVVAPPMVLEGTTGVLLLVCPPTGMARPLMWVGVALLAVIWLSTALWQVPRHAELTQAFDGRSHERLVRSNWIRTIAWSARAVLVLRMAAGA
jgi:hypothetical protein